ncbi:MULTISPECIES: vWA domain-containing protein [Hungatella]|uniref:vWA domain-containing protein n=1 Tax=Hungatella TaxID=1649459 RepID=UPI00155DD0A6|nr:MULTISPECIES: vWA domain-containing protein [Hungatella]
MNRQFYEKHKKRRLEKLWRRSLAWLLAVCICLGNVNIAAFAAESVETGGTGATPSNAKKENSATPSNADRSASEIWLPDGMMKGAELLEEAERAVTNDYRFDFNNLMKMIDAGNPDEEDDEAEDESDTGSAERYKKLFKGYDSFTLFYDNGKFGRLGGDSEEAYAYILVRVPKETYHAYLTGEDSVRTATASEADAAEGGYKLKGDEDIIFLYVNAGEQDVSFYLNLEDVEAGEVTVPNADAIWEEPDKPDKPEVSLPAEGGVNETPAENADLDAAADPGKNKDEANPENPASDRNEEIGENEENGGAKETGGTQENGGKAEAGGTQESGGKVEAGGTQESGGKVEAGGTQENGGRSEAGGTQENGGKAEAGGTQESGGKAEAGGKQETGEQQEAGGMQENGGKAEAGGMQESGGKAEAGVAQENGGRSETGVAQEKVGKSEAGGIQEGGGKSEAGGTQESGEKQEAGGTRESGGEQEAGGTQENGGKAEAGGTQESGGKAEHGAAQENSGKLKAGGKQENTGKPEAGGSQENTGKQEAWRTQKTINTAENDTQNLEEKSNAAAKTELKISGSRHNVFTLMEPLADEEELNESEDEMTFEEWQAMIGDDQDEDEYDDSDNAVYDEEEGIIHLSLNVLPAAVAEVKKEQPKRNFFSRALFKAQDTTERAVLQAGVTSVSNLVPKVSGAHKQIEYLGGDDYRLHLDIAGGGTPLDILLVIDTSGSMAWNLTNDSMNFNGNSRLDKIKKLLGYKSGRTEVDGFIDSILEKNSGNRFGIVSFDQAASAKLSWSNNLSKIKEAVGSLTAQNGTNCEDGLWEASKMLKNVESGHIPYMIFLSDGQPTFYMSQGKYGGADTFEGIDSNGTRRGSGYTNEDYTSQTISAVTCKNGFRELNRGLISYAVNIGGGASNKLLNAIAEDPGRVITAANDTALTSAFTAILESMELKNVKITDTLSQWVELKDQSLSNAVVKVTTDGEEKVLDHSKYRLGYDNQTRTVTLDLSKATSNGILSRDAAYSVSFEIKVSDSAKDYYHETGQYPDTGEDETDYGGNTTSSGQPGFFSNDSAKAIWSGNTEGFTYPRPVVQAPYEPDYQKYIKDNGNGTYDLTLNVRSTVESTSSTTTEKVPADIVFVLDKSGSMAQSMSGGDNPAKGKSRRELVNAAVKKLIESLGKKGCDVRYAGVHFYGISWYGQYYGKADQVLPANGENDWPSVTDKYRTELNIENPVLGTYPYLGLEKAIELLGTGSTAHQGAENLKRYIVFLTDGEPSEDDEKEDATKSKVQLEKLNKLGDVTFFAIGYSQDALSEDGYLNIIENYMKTSTPNIKTNFLPAAGEGDTDPVFNAIENEILNTLQKNTYGVTGVTITDELSDYADFVTTDPSKVTIAINGKAMTAEEYGKAVSSIAISERTGEAPAKIVVTFKADYELKKDAVYSVTFGVKPTDRAYQDYAANTAVNPDDPYGGITGDRGTDAPGNDTSSGKPGFQTNAEATLQYSVGTSHGTLEYDHPVLQVSVGKVKLTKIVDGTAGDPEDQFLIHMYQGDSSYTSVALKNGEISPYIPVTKSGVFRIDESVPMEYRKAGTFLVVKEAKSGNVADGRLNGTEVTVNPGDDLLIEVHNEFGHKPYFHAAAAVTNYTNGSAEVPFNQEGPVNTSLPESPVAAAVDPGERRVAIKILEEDERLA